LTHTRVFGLAIAALLVLALPLSARFGPSPPPTLEPASAPGNVQVVGHVGGRTDVVAVEGDHVYINEGPALTVLDVANPASPAVVGRIPMLGVKDVVVVKDHAYVAGGDGLWAVDVSDPAHPIEMGHCDAPGEGLAVAAGNPQGHTTAYVVESRGYPDTVGRLHVVDVSDPSNPTKAGFHDLLGAASDVEVVGSYVLIIGPPGLWVVDVSDPANPTGVVFRDTWPGTNVALAGDYAYIVNRYDMLVLDISDPAHPTEVGSYDIPGYGYGVAIIGDHAYVAAGYKGLWVVDVSDPANPTEVGSYETPGYDQGWSLAGYIYKPDEARSVAAATVGPQGRTYAYVAAEYAGLRVVDVSDPANPTEVGYHDTLGATSDVVVATGDPQGPTRAYVADRYDGLWVVDVSDPANPTEMGCYGTSAYGVAVATGDRPGPTYAYVAARRSRVGPVDVQVVDVSDPTQPAEVSSHETPGLALGAALAGDYLYISNGNALLVFDVSDPAHLTEVGSYTGEIGDVDVAGDYAYLVIRGSGLAVVDVSDPANPDRVGAYDRVGMAGGVAVTAGDPPGHIYAYVATGYDLQVLDVSDPANPLEAGSYDLPEVGSYGHPEPAFGVDVDGGYVYVANQHEGLFILRFTGAEVTPTCSPTSAPVTSPTPGPSPSPIPEPTPTAQRGRGPCPGPALLFPLLLLFLRVPAIGRFSSAPPPHLRQTPPRGTITS
jgi:hypothetical protein